MTRTRPIEIIGGNVRITSSVGQDVSTAAGTVTIEGTGRVKGDVHVAGGEVLVLGPVEGSIHAGAGKVLIDAAVGGDVYVGAGQLELGPNTRIAGAVRYRGPGDIRQLEGAEVAGGIRAGGERRKAREERKRHREWQGEEHRGGGGWLWPLGLVVLAAILAALFPSGFRRLGAEARANPALAFALGLAVLVGVPIIAIVFAITLIGLPVALLLMLLYGVMLIVGYAGMAVILGDAALARFRGADASRTAWRVIAAVLAMVAIALLARIPFLGGLVVFAVLLAGLGTLMLALRPRPQAA